MFTPPVSLRCVSRRNGRAKNSPRSLVAIGGYLGGDWDIGYFLKKAENREDSSSVITDRPKSS
jgi:hypothetical protein